MRWICWLECKNVLKKRMFIFITMSLSESKNVMVGQKFVACATVDVAAPAPVQFQYLLGFATQFPYQCCYFLSKKKKSFISSKVCESAADNKKQDCCETLKLICSSALKFVN
jgi:hypothetical protein